MIFFAVLGTLKTIKKTIKISTFLCVCSDLYSYAEYTRQEMMHTLRVEMKFKKKVPSKHS